MENIEKTIKDGNFALSQKSKFTLSTNKN